MAFPDRLATRNENIDVSFSSIALPAIPENQDGNAVPFFWSGYSKGDFASAASNFYIAPQCGIWINSYFDNIFFDFSGVKVMGLSANDYGIRTSGDCPDGNTQFFDYNGYVDGMAICYNGFFNVGTTEKAFDLVRVKMGDFTGGDNAPIAAPAVENLSIDFSAYLAGVNLSNVTNSRFFVPALNSTEASPVGLIIIKQNYAVAPEIPPPYSHSRVLGIVIDESNAPTLVSLFSNTDLDYPSWNGVIYAHTKDVTNHYFLTDAYTGIDIIIRLVICIEDNFPDVTYTDYRPGFDDPDLPTYLDEIVLETDANYRFVSICSTNNGFLLTYKKFDGAQWLPHYLHINKDFTSFDEIIVTSADADTDDIVSQSVGNTDANDVNMSHISGSSYFLLLGGSPALPLTSIGVVGADPAPGAPFGVTNPNFKIGPIISLSCFTPCTPFAIRSN